MLEGRYTDAYLANAGADAPRFTPQDLKTISSAVDFVGLNVYAPSQYVLASEAAPASPKCRSRRRIPAWRRPG